MSPASYLTAPPRSICKRPNVSGVPGGVNRETVSNDPVGKLPATGWKAGSTARSTRAGCAAEVVVTFALESPGRDTGVWRVLGNLVN